MLLKKSVPKQIQERKKNKEKLKVKHKEKKKKNKNTIESIILSSINQSISFKYE